MKSISLVLGLLLFGQICCGNVAGVLHIKRAALDYFITPEDGWDLIPTDSLNVRFGNEVFDAGFFTRSNDNQFKGEYVLYRFIPSNGDLCQFSFKALTKEVKKIFMIKSATDSIKKISVTTSSFVENSNDYTFQIGGNINSEKGNRDFSQMIVPTRDGYLLIMAYQQMFPEKKNFSVSPSSLLKSIKLNDVNRYFEPALRKGIGIKQICIAAAIGLIVYFLILYLSEIKKMIGK